MQINQIITMMCSTPNSEHTATRNSTKSLENPKPINAKVSSTLAMSIIISSCSLQSFLPTLIISIKCIEWASNPLHGNNRNCCLITEGTWNRVCCCYCLIPLHEISVNRNRNWRKWFQDFRNPSFVRNMQQWGELNVIQLQGGHLSAQNQSEKGKDTRSESMI